MNEGRLFLSAYFSATCEDYVFQWPPLQVGFLPHLKFSHRIKVGRVRYPHIHRGTLVIHTVIHKTVKNVDNCVVNCGENLVIEERAVKNQGFYCG